MQQSQHSLCLCLPQKPPKPPSGPQSSPEVIHHSTICGISIPQRPQKASLVVLSLPLKPQQYPNGLQPTPVVLCTTTLEICLSTAKPGSRQSHPCCPQPTLVASIAIAGGPQQTTVVPSHHYGGQLTHEQHPCRHYNNLMVLCLTHHINQEVLSQPLYPSQHSVCLQPTTVHM